MYGARFKEENNQRTIEVFLVKRIFRADFGTSPDDCLRRKKPPHAEVNNGFLFTFPHSTKSIFPITKIKHCECKKFPRESDAMN